MELSVYLHIKMNTKHKNSEEGMKKGEEEEENK